MRKQTVDANMTPKTRITLIVAVSCLLLFLLFSLIHRTSSKQVVSGEITEQYSEGNAFAALEEKKEDIKVEEPPAQQLSQSFDATLSGGAAEQMVVTLVNWMPMLIGLMVVSQVVIRFMR